MQVVSLFPLFPGTNEMDQIEKIHAIMGTPAPEVLARMKKHSTHIEYEFNPKVGSSHAMMARRHPACMSWVFKLVWAASCMDFEVCAVACGGSCLALEQGGTPCSTPLSLRTLTPQVDITAEISALKSVAKGSSTGAAGLVSADAQTGARMACQHFKQL